MSAVVVAPVPLRPERKSRYNVTMYPSDVSRIDEYTRKLGCSRSELLIFCFNYWEATCTTESEVVRNG